MAKTEMLVKADRLVDHDGNVRHKGDVVELPSDVAERLHAAGAVEKPGESQQREQDALQGRLAQLDAEKTALEGQIKARDAAVKANDADDSEVPTTAGSPHADVAAVPPGPDLTAEQHSSARRARARG